MTDTITALTLTIKSRRTTLSDASYTRQLLDKGSVHCAKKFGEEAVEAVIAGVSQSDEALTAEAADVVYHLLVLLESRNVPWSDVTTELESRFRSSGLAEKAARSGS